ncbi:hypothetical protein HCEG_05508 [Histoplasma capsulatum var. duboisii H88]|uniref:Rhodopsin family protein n=4 Tax=Ajellomyces capsulatus TaxID=5037 RepID=C0NCC3_AJECG|nr:uncharacterized protein HCBG_00769 [Histoplasma capsulatum G186AR]EER43360.1 hypothetical protein HCDG_03258 [Histoplasma capsulatum H143]EGC46293.1 hypothetical protein HCEG_05508 [Histoplasma capsulatum var. duboisii H88]KAG5289466.1 hypothetical protein I7I48_08794 [Histoplasma ohiense (nom. inval.)]KAG5302840.1 hypothetical protein I7I52_00605 [Histoplasma capsulatum]EEH11314.1 hypothetical protein HCBG_00769 [Histoplasma capsulatum G186AR]
MAICITFGTQEFTSRLKGYENVTAQCHNCGNWSAHCVTRWPWFTVCFVPVLPLSTHKYKEVICHVCRFAQDLSNRPDVESQAGGAAPPPGPYQGHPGWGPQGPGASGALGQQQPGYVYK